MTYRLVEPFTEADGRTTWAVREYVHEQGASGHFYFRRNIISWHNTREEAESDVQAAEAADE